MKDNCVKCRKKVHGDGIYAPPLPGIPVLELMGNSRVLVENHKGVIAYGDTEICVRVNGGMLTIRGCDLSLGYMSRCQLTITGCIDEIAVMRGK